MTDQQMRVAIATWRGWKIINGMWHNPDGTPIGFTPDYPRDLNAMHEAELTLPEEGADICRGHFRWHLRQVCGCEPDMIHATARKRAEALCKTVGIWRE